MELGASQYKTNDMDEERAFFLSTAWCANLLNDPDFTPVATPSRKYKSSTTEDALYGLTLKTKDTFRAVTTIYRRPAPGTILVQEVRQLISLAYGVNGYPYIAHGGIIGVMLDEAMGILLLVNKGLGENKHDGETIDHLVTAYLKVTYLKPVVTPQTVLVTASLKKSQEKKLYVEGEVKDSEGNVLAKAEALWLGLKRSKEKL